MFSFFFADSFSGGFTGAFDCHNVFRVFIWRYNVLGAVYALYAAVVDDGHCLTYPYKQLVFHREF